MSVPLIKTMKSLELVNLYYHEQAPYVQILVDHGNGQKNEWHCLVDQQTYQNLQWIVQRFKHCRYRIYPKMHADQGLTGEVSIIHANWIRKCPLHASPVFLKKLAALLDIGDPAHTKSNASNDEVVQNKRYVPGIDGLRAIAVLAVILYHLDLGMMPGGFLGVTLFFVISGYLITNVLLTEWKHDQGFHVLHFWLRRARRLLPALLTVLVTVFVWVLWFQPHKLEQLISHLLASLFYISNWWYIHTDLSYFEQFGNLAPLGHLWSLAVEEQFYLFFPFLILICMRWCKRQWQSIALLLCGALLSAVAMSGLYVVGQDLSRIYYGTDTRLFSLLIGAALAWVLPITRTGRDKPSKHKSYVLDMVGGWIGIPLLLIMMFRWHETDGFVYTGGMVLFSLLAAAVIASLVFEKGVTVRLMSWQPLQWLGKRSYGIYLWHYPVIVLVNPEVNSQSAQLLVSLMQVIVTLVLAGLMWHYIEQPCLHHRDKKVTEKISSYVYSVKKARYGHVKAVVSLGILSSLLIIGSLFMFEPLEHHSSVAEGKSDAHVNEQQRHDETELSAVSQYTVIQRDPPSVQSVSQVIDQDSADAARMIHNGAKVSCEGVTMIGDSMTLGAAKYLKALMPKIVIDAEVGRQMHDALEVLERLEEADQLGSCVIIGLGTNGSFTEEELASVLAFIGEEKQIYLVNTRVPRDWQDDVNDMLNKAAEGASHVTLIDWFMTSQDQMDWFAKDGVHLRTSGLRVYANMIVSALGELVKGQTF